MSTQTATAMIERAAVTTMIERGAVTAIKEPGVEGERRRSFEIDSGARSSRVEATSAGMMHAHNAVSGVRDPARRGRCLTQWEIDARDAGWEYCSNSTNALMARVLEGCRLRVEG
jgi:hypothetical protein